MTPGIPVQNSPHALKENAWDARAIGESTAASRGYGTLEFKTSRRGKGWKDRRDAGVSLWCAGDKKKRDGGPLLEEESRDGYLALHRKTQQVESNNRLRIESAALPLSYAGRQRDKI